jgi:hypothetical protein
VAKKGARSISFLVHCIRESDPLQGIKRSYVNDMKENLCFALTHSLCVKTSTSNTCPFEVCLTGLMQS